VKCFVIEEGEAANFFRHDGAAELRIHTLGIGTGYSIADSLQIF
jgi:hypothetical protein